MASVILLLKASNVKDVLNFEYMDPPPRDTGKHVWFTPMKFLVLKAFEELYALEAIDEKQELTELGRKMADFPLEPNFAKILIKSKVRGII